MSRYLGRIATGPRLSKDLSRDEARHAMELILRDEVDPVQAAVFLVALRMKRESLDEHAGVLDALRQSATRVMADVDELVDMAEPYNGYVRHASVAAFVPALLAACGVPCVLHGCKEAGPKWGMTAHRVLVAAGVDVDRTPVEAGMRVARTGWAYVDLPHFAAPLAHLSRLRTLIVKRPCLSLLEKLIGPVSAYRRTHLWIGYTHREYPDIIAGLAREFGYASMLAVRGVEGGVLTAPGARSRGARFLAGDALEDVDIVGPEAGMDAASRAPAMPGLGADAEAGGHGHDDDMSVPAEAEVERWAQACAQAGRDALGGKPGPGADMMVLGAAAILRHVGKTRNLAEGAAMARQALHSGEALHRLEQGSR